MKINRAEDSRILTLDNQTGDKQLERVFKALDSLSRIRILRFLSNRVASVSEIATALDLPISTAALHVETLEEAGLIKAALEPASRGLQKLCARSFDRVVLDLPMLERSVGEMMELSMPVGGYVECQVEPTCGLLSDKGIIGLLDDPASFYEPEHNKAQLLWFKQGYVEYRYPNRLPGHAEPTFLSFSLELCSEAPLHNPNWPSDITLWINGVEVGTWTCPGDFGGQPGKYTPDWWTTRNTQYGLLKFWRVGYEGSDVDGMRVSDTSINDLNLKASSFISVRIGVKPDARYAGGINIFGSHFGNYPQDLVLNVHYEIDVFNRSLKN